MYTITITVLISWSANSNICVNSRWFQQNNVFSPYGSYLPTFFHGLATICYMANIIKCTLLDVDIYLPINIPELCYGILLLLGKSLNLLGLALKFVRWYFNSAHSRTQYFPLLRL